MEVEEARSIGARARKIRKRRGLSLEVVAGLAGIKKQYLSMLELGKRGFNRRGLSEDLANALGCSVADLTGQPYLEPDRATADAMTMVADVSRATRAAKSGVAPSSIGTTTAPRRRQPQKAAIHSAPLGPQRSTRSPVRTPLCFKSCARRKAIAASLPYDHASRR